MAAFVDGLAEGGPLTGAALSLGPGQNLDTLDRTALSTVRDRKLRSILGMAKPNTILVKLVSSADTGYFYVAKKNPRTQTEKLEFRKYDPVAKKHVLFKEQRLK